MNGIKLIVFILGRGRGEELLRLCSEEHIGFRVKLHGRGTADSEILSVLGAGPEKDVVLLSVDETRADALTDRFGKALGLDRPGTGIAFTVPLSALVQRGSAYELMAGMQPGDGGAGKGSIV